MSFYTVYNSLTKTSKYCLLRNLFMIYQNREMKMTISIKNIIKKIKENLIYGQQLNHINNETIQDIAEKNELLREIEYIATHDELTGLYNRFYFNKQLENLCQHAKEKQTSFAVMMLNVNGFKYINNALGYQLGDRLIVQIAQNLKTFLSEDNIICRNSGISFSIIIAEISNIEKYKIIAKDIIDLFLYPIKIDNYELDVNLNIGVSIYPDDAQDADSILKYANISLHRAKQEGINNFKFYSPNIDINNYKQFILRNDLKKSIKKNQLKVYYQPQVNLLNNEIIGAEALVRWDHPDWGMIQPNEFIPLAEETGFITNIGDWMLNEVCCNYKKWLNEGLQAIKVSINYSSIQFFEENITDNIRNTIKEYNLDTHFLIIELTESVLIKNTQKLTSVIKNLHNLGIQVALDDFGTGFSSLAYLNSYNIDILKIDHSFIKSVLINENSTIITKTIINLAHELKLELVAEGIENWKQLSFLRNLNCHVGQGYLYSKPVPLKEFVNILIKGKCNPIIVNNTKIIDIEEKRKYFRIKFYKLLEANITIIEFKNNQSNIRNFKALIDDIGPGGLSFFSNIDLTINKDITILFKTELLDEKITVYGFPVWVKEADSYLYKYGINFTIDENERETVTKLLSYVQVKQNNNYEFNGRFIKISPVHYFNSQAFLDNNLG